MSETRTGKCARPDAETLREQLYAANHNRGRVYFHIFAELRKELGEEKAKEIMKRAIYKRGEEIGRQYARFAPDDFAGLRDAFLANIPDGGDMFQPRVVRCDAEGLEIEFSSCPLKTAWQDMGLGQEDCAAICDCAGTVDAGTFEGAGFSFSVQALPQGETSRCILRIGKKD